MSIAFRLIELPACQRSLLGRSPDIGCRAEGRRPWRRQPRSAFTLIELLVVIAIMAVLAALLLPTLTVAKNRAQASVDLNNVHQILLATHLYAGDNDDQMPQPGWAPIGTVPAWATGTPFTFGPATAATYPGIYKAEVDSFKGTKPTYTKPAQLFQYIRNPKVLRCPVDVINEQFYKRGVFITSYVWNGAVVGYAPTWTGVPLPNTFKLSRFKADAILIWEDDEQQMAGFWNDTSNYPDEGISERHGKGATVGMFGGGAERMALRDFYMLAANQPTKYTGGAGTGWSKGQKLPNRLWCNPGKANGGP